MATRRTTRSAAAAARAAHDDSSSATSSSLPPRPLRLRVAFLHPNLGIGGAERLVVDAAKALKARGHAVNIFTNYHDMNHCYPETRDGTLPVYVYGDTGFSSIFGRFHVVIAVFRMVYLALLFALWPWSSTPPGRQRWAKEFDVVVIDQVAHAVPIIRSLTACKVLFYCHFPDQLLAPSRPNLVRRLYRWPIDQLERWSTSRAHRVLVNSEFTRSTFRRTFPNVEDHMRQTLLRELGGQTDLQPEDEPLQVLYPSIDFSRYVTLDDEALEHLEEEGKGEVRILHQLVYGDAGVAAMDGQESNQPSSGGGARRSRRRSDSIGKRKRSYSNVVSQSDGVHASASKHPRRMHLFTSINRFERKKNLRLAIDAFHLLHQRRHEGLPNHASPNDKKSSNGSGSFLPPLPIGLLLCGGYDPANTENREHFLELLQYARSKHMNVRVMNNVLIEDGRSSVDKRRVELQWEHDDQNESEAHAGDNDDHHGSDDGDSSSTPTVYFLRSFTDLQRSWLLSHSVSVLYTPSNEHFGIVPIEAMYMCRPVLCVNSGGPMESVKDLDLALWNQSADDEMARRMDVGQMNANEMNVGDATGFLRPPSPEQWSSALNLLVSSEECIRRLLLSSTAPLHAPLSIAAQMGYNGRKRVLQLFHFRTFQQQLERHVLRLYMER